MIATILWDSSLFSRWHTKNPIDSLLHWLGSQIEMRRIFVLGLVVWSLSSLVYIVLRIKRNRDGKLDGVIEAIGPTVKWDYKKGKALDSKNET